MPFPVVLYPIGALAAVGALLFRSKIKDAAHQVSDDSQRVAANVQNAAKRALEPKLSDAQIKANIAAAIAAGGKQDGAVVFSARDQSAMAKGLPPVFQTILAGPGEPASDATINMLKIAIDAGQGPNPNTTLKTTRGGSLFDTSPIPLGNVRDTDMVDVLVDDLLSVDMNAAGIPGNGSTAFIALQRADLASNTILAENVDPRVPPGLVLAVPFNAINGIEARAR